MTTPAVITKKGKPLVSTHYDGYPSRLGCELVETSKITDPKEKLKSFNRILEKHQIIEGHPENPDINKQFGEYIYDLDDEPDEFKHVRYYNAYLQRKWVDLNEENCKTIH